MAKKSTSTGTRPQSQSASPRGAPVDRGAPATAETLREQADRLGLLEPLDTEPAHVFIADELEP